MRRKKMQARQKQTNFKKQQQPSRAQETCLHKFYVFLSTIDTGSPDVHKINNDGV